MRLTLKQRLQAFGVAVFLYASLWMALLLRDQEILAKTVGIFANELENGAYKLPFIMIYLAGSPDDRRCYIRCGKKALATPL